MNPAILITNDMLPGDVQLDSYGLPPMAHHVEDDVLWVGAFYYGRELWENKHPSRSELPTLGVHPRTRSGRPTNPQCAPTSDRAAT